MKNVIVNIFAFLILIPIVPFDKMPISYLWFLPVIIYIIYSYFRKESKLEMNRIAETKELVKAVILNVIAFLSLCLILSIALRLLSDYTSIIIVYVIFYFILVQNITIRSPGYFYLNISIPNKTLIEKIKVLLLNFIKLFVFYFLFFSDKYEITDKIQVSILEIVLFLYVLVIISRIFIFKNSSILEKIMKVNIYSVNKSNNELD